MSYVEQNLIPGESVIYRARLHWSILTGPVIVAGLFGLPGVFMLIGGAANSSGELSGIGFLFLLIGAIPLTVAILNRKHSEFAVTSKRVILKTGVIQRQTFEMFLNKIESVGVDQSIGARMANFGTINVRGTGGSAEKFDRIENPLEFRRQVQMQISPEIAASATATKQ